MIDGDPRRRLNRLGLYASLLAVFIGILLVARSSTLATTTEPAPTRSSSGLSGPTSKTVQTGDMAPDFTLDTLDGRTIKLSDLRGQPVLINFWATWCVPCKSEMPLLVAAYAQYRSQGLRLLAINTTAFDTIDEVEKFVANYHMDFDVLLDLDDEVGTTWNTLGLPSTYFIDGTGKVVDMRIGQMSASELAEKLKTILPN